MFDCHALAVFVDKRFKEIYSDQLDQIEFDKNKLIRSEESCQVDLLKWGIKWDSNKNRPYFEGHERADVVSKRKRILRLFSNKQRIILYPGSFFRFFSCNSQLLSPKITSLSVDA